VSLFGKVAIGAVGAPTIDAPLSKGISSIVRNSAGLYTITLADKYNKFVGSDFSVFLAAGAPATGSVVMPVIRAISVSAATPTVQVGFVDSAGAAVELASGVTLYFELKFDDSGV
jgi:hypothetical protein